MSESDLTLPDSEIVTIKKDERTLSPASKLILVARHKAKEQLSFTATNASISNSVSYYSHLFDSVLWTFLRILKIDFFGICSAFLDLPQTRRRSS